MENKNTETIKNALIDFISTNYMVEKDEIPLDVSLIDEGIIDSIGLIEISSFMENTYSFTVAENDIVRENFGSVNKMVHFITNKLTISKKLN